MRNIFQNTCKPEGLAGRLMVKGMNGGSHARLAEFGFSLLANVPENAAALDAGCGGGANVARWLKRCPRGRVYGLDYSGVSVAASRELNRAAIGRGACSVFEASVEKIPLDDGMLDYVSAFETVYFWPNIEDTFREVARVLKKGGVFLICNESTGHDKTAQKFAKIIDGMTLYDGETLRRLLEGAGFEDIAVNERPENNWLAVTARKA